MISGEVRAPGGPTTWMMILQYKYVERVVHDVKIYEIRRKISNGDESIIATTDPLLSLALLRDRQMLSLGELVDGR